MEYDRFKEIFNELGIEDEKFIEDKWKLAEVFEGTENLDEEVLKQSIKQYILGQ